MKPYVLTVPEGRNTSRLPDLRGVLQESKPFHPGFLYHRYLIRTGMLQTATTGNRLNNGYGLLFRQADATSAVHLLRKIAGLQKVTDAPSGYLVWYKLMPLHPATGRENHMLHLIDNTRCAPTPGMPDFDIKAIRWPVYSVTDLVFQPVRCQVSDSKNAILLPGLNKQDLIRENGVSDCLYPPYDILSQA
jgi:hypothetical protein